MSNKALIVVDVQYDFMAGGALEVPNAEKILPVINGILGNYDTVILTRDFHPSNHKSFASQHSGKNVFDTVNLNGIQQVLWPDHCIQGSRGADIHEDLELGKCKNVYIFKKGTDPGVDSYSGFYDNDKSTSTGLSEFLKLKGVREVDIVGLAGDYCVHWTALDAVKEGLDTNVILNGVQYLTQDSTEIYQKLYELKKAGITVY